MSNLTTIGASPAPSGPDSIPTSDTGHATAWRAVLIVIYLFCILVGTFLLLAYATVWATSANQPVGAILSKVAQSLLATGILGLCYDLFAREIARQDQRALLKRLRLEFGQELEVAAQKLRVEIARSPLQLDESLKLIDPDRRIEIVRNILRDNIGSSEVAEATLRNIFALAGEKGELWRDTSHTVEFHEEAALNPYQLIRLSDRISYRARLSKAVFRAGLLRSREIMDVIRRQSNIDAFWLAEKGFIEENGKLDRLVSFRDFCVTYDGNEYRPEGTPSTLEDGSAVIEYRLPESLVGTEVKVSYCFLVVVDRTGPYLHVALPCPSVGLHILLRNYVPAFSHFESRIFVPDSASVERGHIGSDVFEIRTSQVVLKGHGAVVLLR